MTTNNVQEQILEKQIEKQMGCMSGFFQLFDRHLFLTSKKFHTTKRLTPATAKDRAPELEKKSGVPSPIAVTPLATPELKALPTNQETKSAWKLNESGRLSLDSRATYDAAKGSLHRTEIREDDKQRPRSSTSVIAKLMGLEPPAKPIELRRSASESRVSRDLFHYKFIEGNRNSNSNNMQQNQSDYNISNNQMVKSQARQSNSKGSSNTWRSFEAAEVFPEPPKKVESVTNEKKLKIRGIHEASKDLETLKQILEAWQLKGLLHSKRPYQLMSQRNVIYSSESPNFIMRPSKPPIRNDSSPLRRSCESLTSVSPRRKSPTRARSLSDDNVKRSNTIIKAKSLSVETQRSVKESSERKRTVSLIQSPKVSPRKNGSNQPTTKKVTAKKEKMRLNESSSISESSVSTSSLTDTERPKDGCDKLHHSITEMGATDQQQSSPVSVLDSSYYEFSSPLPITKRTIDFKDHPDQVKEDFAINSEDCDLIYISEILRASHYLSQDSDLFSWLEKEQNLKREESKLERKLIFDTITEILERNKQLPPWKDCITKKPTIQKIWSEFQKIQKHDDSTNVICGVLKKDLAVDDMVEHSEVVLDIERMIFRDLVGESIRDLTQLAYQTTLLVVSRRKLIF